MAKHCFRGLEMVHVLNASFAGCAYQSFVIACVGAVSCFVTLPTVTLRSNNHMCCQAEQDITCKTTLSSLAVKLEDFDRGIEFLNQRSSRDETQASTVVCHDFTLPVDALSLQF